MVFILFKINLLNEANDSKFVARKWNIVNDNSNANCSIGNEITYNTEVLKSNLCGYNGAYIFARGDATVKASPQIQVAFTNCAPSTKCITKIDGTTIDDAENLDLVVPMYNLIEHSSNCSGTTGKLCFYSKDEATNFSNNMVNTNNFKFFKYKAKLLETAVAQPAPNTASGILTNASIALP